MSNPTSNFGWQMPTATDLVTDLPADFEVFGQAVDTSLADLKGGTTGQVLSKATNADMDFTWVAQDDSNAIQNAIVDAKGDLIAATANDTPARLAVGTNETRLVADSTQSTGLKYVADTTNYAIDAKGDLLAGTAADTVARLAVGANNTVLTADSSTSTGLKWAAVAGTSFTTGYNYVTTSQTTTSTSFTDLATTQAVTVTTGTKAMIILKAVISNAASYANTGGTLGVTVSGATTLSASDEHAVGMNVYNPSSNFQINMRGSILLTGLTAGSNTFTMKFKDTNGATSTFFNRSIAVIDLGS